MLMDALASLPTTQNVQAPPQGQTVPGTAHARAVNRGLPGAFQEGLVECPEEGKKKTVP